MFLVLNSGFNFTTGTRRHFFLAEARLFIEP